VSIKENVVGCGGNEPRSGQDTIIRTARGSKEEMVDEAKKENKKMMWTVVK